MALTVNSIPRGESQCDRSIQVHSGALAGKKPDGGAGSGSRRHKGDDHRRADGWHRDQHQHGKLRWHADRGHWPGAPYDTASIKQVDANTFTYEAKSGTGKYRASGRTVISSDGKSMTTKATGNLVLQETITLGPSSGQGQVRPSEQHLRISIDTTLRVTVEYRYCLSGFSTIIFPRKAILTAFGCPFCKYGSNSQPKAAFRTFGEMWATRHPTSCAPYPTSFESSSPTREKRRRYLPTFETP